MSSLFMVKCQGKNLNELKKSLRAALKELGEDSVSTSHKVEVSVPSNDEDTDTEEYEEVASPYSQPQVGNAPSQSTPTSTSELDSEGMPWDSRIHSSSKAKVKDGSWRLQRGVDSALVDKIKAEYKRAGTTPTYEAPVAQPSYQAPVQQAPQTAPAQPVQQAPAMPMMNQQSGHTLDTFKANFPMILVDLINQGKLTQDYVNALKNYFKVPEIYMVNDEQKAMIFDQFVQYNFVTRVG